MAIFIRSNHLEISEVESAIYNLDNSVIDFETLQSIGKKRVSVIFYSLNKTLLLDSPGHPV